MLQISQMNSSTLQQNKQPKASFMHLFCLLHTGTNAAALFFLVPFSSLRAACLALSQLPFPPGW